MGHFHDARHLRINHSRGALAVFTCAARQGGPGEWILTLTIRDLPQLIAHAPASYHLARDRSHTLQVILCASRDATNGNLFSSASAKRSYQLGFQHILGVI